MLDDPLPHEMVIEMGAVGLCHTDLSVSEWLPEPRVLGHEGAGKIVAVGESVTGFAVGDRVVATFGSCGHCRNCLTDHPAYCLDHEAHNFSGTRPPERPALTRADGTPISAEFFQQSSFATHAIVTERNCVKIPDDLDFAIAAPLGCGIQTGAGAVLNNFAAEADKPLLVIGCGAVGLSAVMAARIAGSHPIIAVDMIEERLELARSLGAQHALTGDEPDLLETIRELTGGGMAYALDCAGKQQTFELGINSLSPGGKMGVVTVPGQFGEPVSHPGGLPFMTTTMIGIVEGDSNPETFIPWLIEQQQSGAMPYERLIKRYPFDDISDAFADCANGTAIKPVLVFD